MAKKKKKRSLLSALLDILLTPIDWLCEGTAFLLVSLMKGILKLLTLLLSGLWRLVLLLFRALALPFVWLWRRLTGRYLHAGMCEKLTGTEFEHYVALLLKDHYYRHIEITKGSGDQGVDILCERNGKTYAIQCKNYAGAVGNFAVQEAYAGAEFYGCDIPVVICPGSFSRGAIELAETTDVELWDGETLTQMMQRSGRKPRRSKTA